ncbi:MAG TPA: 3-methyl-2-oxobutanoate hydroxymethyltransferase [Firmicutes bacterium]|jgi:3-methyl-2-oxobutanoate hydroxymethyltransferase|nr:3-methyl-2-oxobutanoate hydroxymethyltransferase [Bacillota bacterium]HAZ21513.1 3-methyl-2-oxobutanoate hydroxymethyltransferase [Bacillota bacterium]HBE05641.1 3-methyl-2-oxobutanoate hydroxymethyltransferase [Bacillota bacterium]HBG45183.1 3-methyl-2-oxobutanoate hydroxymethyltransferase [Bacillota bacterium]HBR24481.1 3-methyl-2-oxobutanoate hydroxymethyltransferase [Bacillota bacterium]
MPDKFTTQSFLAAKKNNRKITMLTGYDYSMAQIMDSCGVDAILVGDSLGMVVQGRDSTVEVTIDEMLYHCKCVARGAKNAMLVGDMPFLTYHINDGEAVRNAGRFIQEAGMNAVKLEGGKSMADTIKAIVRAQIPVMGHIGLTPQSINVFGGFKVQGKEERTAKALIEDALAVEDAGAFAVVLEAVPEALARIITEKVSIPTIGIGAGRYCDGQVLVVNDLLGLYSGFTPKFVKKYADLKSTITDAINGYISDVRTQQFPEKQHTYPMSDAVLEKLVDPFEKEK